MSVADTYITVQNIVHRSFLKQLFGKCVTDVENATCEWDIHIALFRNVVQAFSDFWLAI